MLYGRREECARVAALLARARAGQAGVLVVCGDAGIGKSALLRDAAEQADDMYLVRGAGVESEVDLDFGALHQLLRPVLDRLDRLPAPQADALRGAFGLADAKADPVLVELGWLSLLTDLATEHPVLCLVDDAQWLDPASTDALEFVARRVSTERILLLLAARDMPVPQLHLSGLPELHLRGLDPEAAAQLLQAQVGQVAPDVRDRLIEETGGNPLALEELPATLTSPQLAGQEPLPHRLRLGTGLQQAFGHPARQLPAATRTLLLVAAAEDAGELATVLAAGRLLGADPEALEPAEQAGLVHVAGRGLEFRHPLVRSAVYDGATFTARQAIHEALIKVLDAKGQADRRAWHLAAATIEPDEDAAEALEAAAGRAHQRGSPTAAATALERAAALTPLSTLRDRRLVAAAEHQWEAGHLQRAQMLLDQAEPRPTDAAVQARIASVRGRVELAAGTPTTACTLLIQGARLVLESRPGQAIEMLVAAAQAALAADRLDRLVHQICPIISRLSETVPGQPGLRVRRVADSLIAVGLTRSAGLAQGPPGQDTTWPHPASTWVWPMLLVAEAAADEASAARSYARLVATERAAGRVSSLIVALGNLAKTQSNLGRWCDAVGSATEGLRLCQATGQHATAGHFLVLLAWIASEQGRPDESRQLAEEALAVATPRRLAVVAAHASWVLAQLDLAEGRPRAALERLLALATPGHPTAHAPIALLATGELVEAAARADALEGMEPHVACLERWAHRTRQAWFLVTGARCRALITRGEDAERHFQAALAVAGIDRQPLAWGRTELAYGEWLRRARRRADARPHLRTALELFERLGATPRVEQARTELRASGETARARDPSTSLQLTPQERQIARLASQGLSNLQIADQLLLSRHTVSYHLHRIFAKLNITCRANLSRVALDLDGDPDQGSASAGPPGG
jgi:DNA-binding CsgD family transcriptional regulator